MEFLIIITVLTSIHLIMAGINRFLAKHRPLIFGNEEEVKQELLNQIRR